MNKKGFTLVEMLTAIAIIAMLIGFASVIFTTCSDAYRSADANMEIMQNLRAITLQLDKDFEGFCNDGYLYIRNELKQRKVYDDLAEPIDVRMDRIYYFATGDFQSWFEPYPKSNIARIFIGHDSESLNEDIDLAPVLLLSECRLARDVLLLTPGETGGFPSVDYDDISFAQCKTNVAFLEGLDPNGGILEPSVSTYLQDDVDNVRRFFCENIGEFKIEWTYGAFASDGRVLYSPGNIEGSSVKEWKPQGTMPEAIKFTFTLYDSKNVLKGGRRFTHIVYLKDD